jgi:hypothetical protein
MREPIEVDCTRCGASPKQPCVSRYGNTLSYFHAPRKADAEGELAELIDLQEVRRRIEMRRAEGQ